MCQRVWLILYMHYFFNDFDFISLLKLSTWFHKLFQKLDHVTCLLDLNEFLILRFCFKYIYVVKCKLSMLQLIFLLVYVLRSAGNSYVYKLSFNDPLSPELLASNRIFFFFQALWYSRKSMGIDISLQTLLLRVRYQEITWNCLFHSAL